MKRLLALLASVGFACSGADPLVPVPPGAADAGVPTDAGAPPPAMFTIAAPHDGELLLEPQVEVRGTATGLTRITIAGVETAVVDGAFSSLVLLDGEGHHEIEVSATGAAVRIPVDVDLSPPLLEILSPSRGAFFDAREGATIHVEGRAVDAVSGIYAVTVGGTPVELSGDRFAIDLVAEHGVNLIEAVAYDGAGRRSDVLQGAIWGDYAPWDGLLPDAVSLGVRADVFDTFEQALEDGITTQLSSGAMSAPPANGFTVDAIAFTNLDVQIVPETGDLALAVTIEGLAIDFTLDTVVLGFPVQTTGVITADRVDLATEAHVDTNPAGGVAVHLEGSSAAISGFNVTAVGVAPFLTGVLAGTLQPQLEMGFVQALDGQDVSSILDLSQLLPEGVAAQITRVDIDPSGMGILADAAVQLPPAPDSPPAPGILVSGGAAPSGAPTSRMLRTSLSEDLVNGILFSSWRAGTLTTSIAPAQVPGEIALDAATLALFFGDELFDYAPETSSVAISLRPLLPPVARLVGAAHPTLEVTAADVMLDFVLEPEGQAPIRFATFALVLDASTELLIDQGGPATRTRVDVRIDLVDAPLFPIEEEPLEDLITNLVVTAQLAAALGGHALPLDTGALTNVVFAIDGPTSTYLSILGDL